MKHLGKWKTQGLITLIFVLLLLLMPFQDYTERTFLMDSMNYPEDLIGTLNTDEGTIQVPVRSGLLCAGHRQSLFPARHLRSHLQRDIL